MLLRRRLLFLFIIALLLIGITPTALRAQNAEITLTLGIPGYLRDVFSQNLIGKFEADHPGVKVQIKEVEPEIPPAADDLDKHLAGVEKYVSAADVVYVEMQSLTQEATRAGYYLDLAPLASTDTALNVDDFWPALWKAFQWDKGVWGLPTGTNILVLSYDPAAFDAAGVAYPSGQWTLDDFTNAIRKLSQTDANGNVTVHGIDIFADAVKAGLLRSLIGENLYDDSTIPDQPKLTGANTISVLDAWAALEKDGLIGQEFNKAPMSISPLFAIAIPGQNNPNEKRMGVLVPGNKGGLEVQGYAASAGTTHPDLAYALVSYLSKSPLAAGPFSGTPARKSLAQGAVGNSGPVKIGGSGSDNESSASGSTTSSDGGGDRGPVFSMGPALPPELKALADEAVTNGLGGTDLRYTEYLLAALKQMKAGNSDAATVLPAIEAQAATNQRKAVEKKTNTAIIVATPIPSVGQPGKATLNFGVTSFINPMPNRDKWDQLANEFAQTDAEIGKVNLTTGFGSAQDSADKHDCFYLPYNGVPSARLNKLLNLDPFLSADSTFDKADVVGNVMAQLTRDNKVWALPIMIEPSALKYHSEQFGKANIPAPVDGWTIEQFNDALKTLKSTAADASAAPFNSNGPGGTHLLALIAAYGGLPLDFRTSPATVDFTSPETIAAIKQVLDLAKAGYIKYEALGKTEAISIAIGGGPGAPIITYDMNGIRMIRRSGSGAQQEDPYKTTLYPHGTKYNAISYGIGTAYISAGTQNAEACYRFITKLAQHPELFSSMPARRSLINDATVSAAQGPDVTALYNAVDKLLSDSNTISLPSMFEGGVSPTGFIAQHWLFEAFDKYTLEDGDLDAALKDAEKFVKEFQTCAADIAPFDPSSGQTQQQYDKQYLQCAAKVDPRLQSFIDAVSR